VPPDLGDDVNANLSSPAPEPDDTPPTEADWPPEPQLRLVDFTGGLYSDPELTDEQLANAVADAAAAAPAPRRSPVELGRAVVDYWRPPSWSATVAPTMQQICWGIAQDAQAVDRGWVRLWDLVKDLVKFPFQLVGVLIGWATARGREGRLALAVCLYAVLAHTVIGAWLPWPGWMPF
jgi:hypothetical protein